MKTKILLIIKNMKKFILFFAIVFCNNFFAYAQLKIVMPIDSAEYYSNQTEFDTIWEKSNVVKKNGVIKISLNNWEKFIEFKDQKFNEYEDDYYENDDVEDDDVDVEVGYYVIGEKKEKNWLLILEGSINTLSYYLINQKLGRYDMLVGFPVIYGNRILCLEEDHTDWEQYIEIWNIKDNNDIYLYKRFSLAKMFNIYVESFYLKDDFLYVKDRDYFNDDGYSKYYKININIIRSSN